jgi:hypothetical protein
MIAYEKAPGERMDNLPRPAARPAHDTLVSKGAPGDAVSCLHFPGRFGAPDKPVHIRIGGEAHQLPQTLDGHHPVAPRTE